MGLMRAARVFYRRSTVAFWCCVPGHTQNAPERTRSVQKACQGAEVRRSSTRGREGCQVTH
jgi:hypothetical protein